MVSIVTHKSHAYMKTLISTEKSKKIVMSLLLSKLNVIAISFMNL